MKIEVVEFMVGVFVVIGLACIGYMTVKLGKMELFDSKSYTIKAQFTSVAGLKKLANVEMSGIQVGNVAEMYLDPDEQLAIVELRIRNDVKLGDDVIASIRTSGLIGDKYISLTPGGSEEYLQDGDSITETESSVSLEELISKYVFGGVK